MTARPYRSCLILACLMQGLVVPVVPEQCVDNQFDEAPLLQVATKTGERVPLSRAFQKGMQIPLDASRSRLLIKVSIMTGMPPVSLLLDTGSSTVAICNKSFPTSLGHDKKTDILACETYGPKGANGEFTDGYVGPFYKGALTVGGQLSIDDAYYVIFDGSTSCAPGLCKHGMSGIFGIAYKKMNKAYFANQVNSSVCSPGFLDNEILCPRFHHSLMPPTMQVLSTDFDEHELLGLYWSGARGDNVGAMYLGPAAVSNSHYSASLAQKAKLLDFGPLSSGWYNVNVSKISIHDQEFTGFDCTSSGRPCIVDTGTPELLLPEGVAVSAESTSLKFELQAYPESAPVVLEFNLVDLRMKGLYVTTDPAGPMRNVAPLMVIGFPLWAYYYTVFDLTENSISFVKN